MRNTLCPMLGFPGELLSGATDEEVKTCHPLELASLGYIFKRVWNGNYSMGTMGQTKALGAVVVAE